MGNIETLQRYGKHDKGFGIIDNLSYSYSGNQLQKVTDMADASLTSYGAFHFVDGANDEEEYTYDANGNMTADLNKGIDEIFYNSLNLPDEVRFTSGHKNQYIYDAEGTLTCKYLGIPTNFLFSPMERLNAKDRTWWGVTSRSAYYDNVMYTYSSFFDFPPVTLLIDGGYVSLNGPRPQYHFYVQVHLGNNRVVVDETGTVEEVNHYTPFGALMADRSEPSVQPYKYNELFLFIYQNDASNKVDSLNSYHISFSYLTNG